MIIHKKNVINAAILKCLAALPLLPIFDIKPMCTRTLILLTQLLSISLFNVHALHTHHYSTQHRTMCTFYTYEKLCVRMRLYYCIIQLSPTFVVAVSVQNIPN